MSGAVDKAVISALNSEVGESVTRRLFGVFHKECKTFAAALEDELHQDNIEQVCIIAHSFKGSAQQFGANKLSNLCRTLETLSDAALQNPVPRGNDDMFAALSEIKTESARVQSHLDDIFTDSPAQLQT